MKLSESVQPISYLKAHASEIIRDLSGNNKTLVITHNGKAKAVLQDVAQFEKTQESLALLRMLVLSTKNLKQGKVTSLRKAFSDVRKEAHARLQS